MFLLKQNPNKTYLKGFYLCGYIKYKHEDSYNIESTTR